MYENAAGLGSVAASFFFALGDPEAATVGKRGLRIYTENAAAGLNPLFGGTPKYAQKVRRPNGGLSFRAR